MYKRKRDRERRRRQREDALMVAALRARSPERIREQEEIARESIQAVLRVLEATGR